MHLCSLIGKALALLTLMLGCELLNADIPPSLQGLPYAIYADDIEYNTARFNYNQRFNIFPLAIISPTTQAEAIFVLTQFKNYNLPFAVRGGGHCYEPGSLSSGYIFDLTNFNSITIDALNSQATIGAGCLLKQVIDTLGIAGYAIPTGTCGSVGVAGLTLGGGVGFLGRTYGLTSDSVLSFTLLTADATIIEVSANSYPDLFWALRGGGNGAYGIVLDITFRLLTVPDVCYYEISFPWNSVTAPIIFSTYQNWISTLSDNISAIANTLYSYGTTILSIEGLKVNSTATSNPFTEWESAFLRFNPTVKINYGTYYEMSQLWVGNDSLPFRKAISNVLIEPINAKGIRKIYTFIEKLKKDNAQLEFNFQVEALGGQVSKSDAPVTLTKGFAWMYQPTIWNQQDRGPAALKYSRKFHSLVSKYVSKYAYGNTVDYSLQNYFMTAYFGSNCNQLIAIKNKYDPGNLFKWQQSIPETVPVAGGLMCQ